MKLFNKKTPYCEFINSDKEHSNTVIQAISELVELDNKIKNDEFIKSLENKTPSEIKEIIKPYAQTYVELNNTLKSLWHPKTYYDQFEVITLHPKNVVLDKLFF